MRELKKLNSLLPNLLQKTFKTGLLGILILIFLCQFGLINGTKAAYYNLGSLDVVPIPHDGAQNRSWFVEFLKPNQEIQEQLRISNFSSAAKNLEIYVADATDSQNSNFLVHDRTEKQDDLNNWVNLPTRTLNLQGGESRIISVNLKLPDNAGIGLHSGAIIVREKTSDNIAMEKGVRIYLNVTGFAVTKTQIKKSPLRVYTIPAS